MSHQVVDYHAKRDNALAGGAVTVDAKLAEKIESNEQRLVAVRVVLPNRFLH